MAVEVVKHEYKPGRGQRYDVVADGVKVGEVHYLPPIQGFPFASWAAVVDGVTIGDVADTRLEAVSRVLLHAGVSVPVPVELVHA